MEISTLPFPTADSEEFKLHIWDFGGQSIQRYAHQFFLTGSSVYALLSNSREENSNFQYWLNIIEMLGGDSPVLIVQNKKAGHEAIRNESTIRERFKNVVNEFYSVNLEYAATEPDFERIKQKICHLAAELSHLTREYPGSFARIRAALEALNVPGQETPINNLTWPDYRALCQREGVDNEDLMQDIATAFTTIGICQWSPKLGLRQYVFLRPKWIIDALFKLIYHPDIKAWQGLLDAQSTLSVWKGAEYDRMHEHLLKLMEEYYLSFPIANKPGFYIVPQLLPAAKQEERWTESETIQVIFRYGFRPEGIVTRLICRLHALIEPDKTAAGRVWNDAVVFNYKNKTRAFVREVFAEKDIVIEAAGEKPSTLLQRIIDEIDAIHREAQYANLKVDQLVQCNCPLCQKAETPHFFNFNFLIRLLEKNVKASVVCEKSLDPVSAAEVYAQTGKKLEERPHERRF